MAELRIEQRGAEWVVKDGKRVIARCATHAEAWRFVDRYTGEPVSAAEKRTEYGIQRRLDGD